MIVLRRIISSKETKRIKYPGIWPKPLIGLDKDIEIYEIQESEKPSYNPNQYDCVEKINLTDNKGEVYNIALIEWELIEKSQKEVIEFLNKSVGEWIDGNGRSATSGNYPQFEQSKHAGRSIRYLNKALLGQELNQEELNEIAFITISANWATECRNKRDVYENEYLTTGILPDIIWPERPDKP